MNYETLKVRFPEDMNVLDPSLSVAKPEALEADIEVFSDEHNLHKIVRYVMTGQFPWEGG